MSHVQSGSATAKEILMVLDSVLTCPVCGHAKAECRSMPANGFTSARNAHAAAAQAGRLLRVLLVWHATLPADAGERGACVLPACQHWRTHETTYLGRPSSCTQ